MEPLIERRNYELVTEYLTGLAEEAQITPASVKRYSCYLRHLLFWAMETPLGQAHTLHSPFPAYLDHPPSGDPSLAAGTRKKIVENARKFFEWAKMNHPAEFKSLPPAWIQKLKIMKRITRPVDHEPLFVTLEEAITLATIPYQPGDLAAWRDRAMAARLFLTGERASAAVSSPISAIDFAALSLKQFPDLGVRTKNRKSAVTYLLQIPQLLDVAKSWDTYVRTNLPPWAVWFAPIYSEWGEQTLSDDPPGKNRHIALNKRLRTLFDTAGLSYKSAHKFRHGHAAYGLLHCHTMPDYKALSLNLMHESLETTDSIYVHMLQEDMRTRIAKLSDQATGQPDDELGRLLVRISPNNRMKAINLLSGMMMG